MPPSPLRPRLIQLNLKGRIWRTEVLCQVSHDAGGTPELPQLEVGDLSQVFADLLGVFGIGFECPASLLVSEETGRQNIMFQMYKKTQQFEVTVAYSLPR